MTNSKTVPAANRRAFSTDAEADLLVDEFLPEPLTKQSESCIFFGRQQF
jgi:hypothetical protein